MLITDINIKSKGVLHVGAHLLEEKNFYVKNLGTKNILWVEANKELAGQVKNNKIVCEVVANADNKIVDFNIANNNQSSSILELGTHRKEHPEVFYTKKEKRRTKTIDTICEENDFHDWDFLNLDIQGAELLALEGAVNSLTHVDYIYTEVNKRNLYKDCAIVDEIDKFLYRYGFIREKTVWTPHGWGDALYGKVF